MALLTPIRRFTFQPALRVVDLVRTVVRMSLPVGLLFFLLASTAAATISRENQVKAVFLFNFAQFTQWPAGAFQNNDSPIVIGILGADPFGRFLDDTVANEQVDGRRLVVKRFRTVEEIKTCHILYIGDSEAERLSQVCGALRGKPILTVSDIANAALRGVMIGMEKVRNKIRLQINLESAKAANLSLSSKLLRAAEVVGADRE